MNSWSISLTLIVSSGLLLIPIDFANAEESKVPLGQSIGIEFAEIPPGEFQMGSPENEPDRRLEETPHTVHLATAFQISKTEVTQAQFEKVMGFNPSSFKDKEHSGLPVEQVSWFDAVMFCNRLSEMEGRVPVYKFLDAIRKGDSIGNATVKVVPGNGFRLPTEAEWEYCCRAATTTAFSVGATIGSAEANFGEIEGQIGAVDKYAANPWGLHNMHGNVSEWCWDAIGSYPSEATADPTGSFAATERVFRGGNWKMDLQFLRSACRLWISPGMRGDFLGFRVAHGSQAADPAASMLADADHEILGLNPHIGGYPPEFNDQITREVATDRIQSTIQLLADLDKTHPHNSVVEMRLGEAYRMAYMLDIEGACDSAETCLKKAIADNSNYYQAHTTLGTLYVQSNQTRAGEAEHHFKRAIEIAGDGAVLAYRGLVFAYILQGDPQKAMEAAEQCLKIDPGMKDVQQLRSALRNNLKSNSPTIEVKDQK
jgi:formylglycine-generating enzyme required for sulfatase activity